MVDLIELLKNAEASAPATVATPLVSDSSPVKRMSTPAPPQVAPAPTVNQNAPKLATALLHTPRELVTRVFARLVSHR